MSIFNGLSVRWKIYSIAIVSILGFGSYLSFNIYVNTQNAALLANIRDAYFPILEKASNNAVRLDRISEMLNTAVLTGEEEYVEQANETAAEMNAVFQEIVKLETNQKEEVSSIIKIFNDYYKISSEISREMANGTADFSLIGQRVEIKEAQLATLREKLTAFIEYAHLNFTGDIKSANNNAEQLLNIGLIIGAINILILTTAVYAIARIILTNINAVSESLNDIAQGGGDFTKQITVSSKDEIGKLATSFNALLENLKEKTNDLISMMQNMHQGLFTICRDETIHPEYASYIEKIFETKEISGKQYSKLLFEKGALGSDTLNQINACINNTLGSDAMMWDFNRHILPNEYKITFPGEVGQTTEKILEIDWDPIVADDEIDKIMVTVRDVTELRAMQAEAEAQREELEIIGQILQVSTQEFDKFIQNTNTLLDKNRQLIISTNSKSARVIADLFVNMHTIKGNVRTYGFDKITDTVHDAETSYDRLRKDEAALWEPQLLLEELDSVSDKINRYKLLREEKLKFENTEDQVIEADLAVTQNNYDKLLQACQQLETSLQDAELPIRESMSEILSKIQSIGTESIASVLSRLIKSLPSIAAQLDKEPPDISLDIDSIRIQKRYSTMLADVFTHLLRNSLDHGIESAEARAAIGKEPVGTIEILAKVFETHACLVVKDDGRGLALQKLLEKSDSDNAKSASPEEVAELLFSSGISTADKVTELSGRGVGMDAVRSYLREQGADINVVLLGQPKITDEFAPFELHITLPKTMYVSVLHGSNATENPQAKAG